MKILSTIIAISIAATTLAQDKAPQDLKRADQERTRAEREFDILEIGSPMPGQEIIMQTTNGSETSLDLQMKDNGLLVMFSCNTCPYVIKAQERTREMITYAQDNNIGFIIINSNEAQREEEDSYEAMRQYADEHGYEDVPYAVDKNSELANRFGATRTPEVFLFSKEQVLMYHGAMEDNPASPSESEEIFLKNAIDKMIAGERPEPAFTKSIGCTIKRKS